LVHSATIFDVFPQTNPTSANEANLENLMKTMFEHEQHDAGLFGRRARDTAQGTLARQTRTAASGGDSAGEGHRAHQHDFGRTNPTDRSIASWQTDPTRDSVTHQPNEPNGQ
jgi:hypothetical protein